MDHSIRGRTTQCLIEGENNSIHPSKLSSMTEVMLRPIS
jgi:hypothetical protein